MEHRVKNIAKKIVPPFAVGFIYKVINLKRFSKYPKFVKDYLKFKSLNKNARPAQVKWREILPVLNEATPKTDFDRHYIYHPAWAARILAENKPKEHVDISSILSFSTIVSAFIPVVFYDYRPAEVFLEGLDCKQADLVKLPFNDNSISSLSCMHTVEHIGLGRYGDKLDPEGDLKAIKELQRVLAPGGSLLFVVPVGKPKIIFNGHRIYAYSQIIEYFSALKLQQFTLIPDASYSQKIIYNATKQQSDEQVYGCGCFWFTKP